MRRSLRRTLTSGSVALITALGITGPAAAFTSYELVWTGTTGSGTTGSGTIAAQAGDVLTLDVLIFSTEILYGWQFTLLGSNVSAVSGEECPFGASSGSSSNLATGLCTTGSSEFFQPIAPGVSVVGSNIWDYDGGSLSGALLTSTLFVGRGVFTANGVGKVDLEADCPEGSGCALVYLPEATATIVPEPGSIALLGLGITALCVGARRRR